MKNKNKNKSKSIIAGMCLLFMAVSLLASCMSVQVAESEEDIDFNEPPTYEALQSHFLFNLINAGQPRTGAQICGGRENVVKVEHQYFWYHGLLASITAGIWTPSTLKVWCK